MLCLGLEVSGRRDMMVLKKFLTLRNPRICYRIHRIRISVNNTSSSISYNLALLNDLWAPLAVCLLLTVSLPILMCDLCCWPTISPVQTSSLMPLLRAKCHSPHARRNERTCRSHLVTEYKMMSFSSLLSGLGMANDCIIAWSSGVANTLLACVLQHTWRPSLPV